MFRLAEELTLVEPRLEDQVRSEDDEQERAVEIEVEQHLGETAGAESPTDAKDQRALDREK